MISTPEFKIITITPEIYERRKNESIGSKYKFWFERENRDYLYKQARPNIGKDWAKKVAAELCKLLGLPHAEYELAETWDGNRGVVSPKLLLKEGEILVNGNKLLVPIMPNYDPFATYKASQHTMEVFDRIPSDRISLIAINFTQKILEYNQCRLLNLKEQLP